MTAQFELRGDAERGTLALSTPLGSQLALALWRPGEAQLTTPQGTRRFDELGALAEQMLGQALPLAALIDWLHGRPWPGAPSAGTGSGFEQLGWSIDLAGFGEGRVLAQRPAAPAVNVRAVLDR